MQQADARAVLEGVLGALRQAGVTPLVLRRPASAAKRAGGATAFHDRQLRLLVPPAERERAIRALEALPWRYSWRRSGLMRLTPLAYYWWDGGIDLDLRWGDAALPLPPRLLRGVTDALWRGASGGVAGASEPSAAALLVHLAVQGCRPGVGHDDDWEHFREALAYVPVRDQALRIARAAGVARALARALDAADAGRGRPNAVGVFDDGRELLWRAARALLPRLATPRLQRVLAGSPMLGDTTIRCRVGSVEVQAEPGVFVPTPDADLFVAMASTFLAIRPTAKVVEIGTGCGAIALAIARAHPEAEVHGTDLFAKAVGSARRNAARLQLQRVRFHEGSVLAPLPSALHGAVDLLIANLPFYPAAGYAAIGSVPRETIQGGGDDGLTLVRTLARDARRVLRPGGRLLLQMFATQWDAFAEELATLGYRPGEVRPFGPFVIGMADLGA